MAVVERVRLVGGWAGLTDSELAELATIATDEVHQDLVRVGAILPDASTYEELVVLRTCALAARRVRTPNTESAGGVSASYVPLHWEAEYGRAFARLVGRKPAWGLL